MARTIITMLLLASLAGCGGGMSRAYEVLPNTFDDLAQQTKAFRHGRTKAPKQQRRVAAGA